MTTTTNPTVEQRLTHIEDQLKVILLAILELDSRSQVMTGRQGWFRRPALNQLYEFRAAAEKGQA